MSQASVSIIVPSYNEEKNIQNTITEVSKVLVGLTDDYEFVIVNDCSTDRTGEIITEMAKKNPRVNAYHNPKNLGLGGTYRRGIELAQKEYVMMVPGDNELSPDSVRYILGFEGQADLIIPYPENIYFRPYMRQVISLTFTAVLNSISGFQIGYYNGPVLVRKKVLSGVSFNTTGFAFQAEILVQLLRGGFTYLQVPFKLNYTSTRLVAFKPKNVISVCKTILRLYVNFRLKSKKA